LDSSLAGEYRREFLTAPLRMGGAVLERVLVDEAIEMVRQGIGHLRRAAGAGAICEARHPLGG
jgi:hypothetical protein